MFNCGVIFLFVASLIIIYMLTSQRRQNLCLLLSILTGVIVSVVFGVLKDLSIVDFSFLQRQIVSLFAQQIYHFPEQQQMSFAFSFILVCIYSLTFVFGEIFFNIVIPKYNYLVKKDASYIFGKISLMFVNILLTLALVMVFLTVLNNVYHVERGFISPVMELIEEGLLSI